MLFCECGKQVTPAYKGAPMVSCRCGLIYDLLEGKYVASYPVPTLLTIQPQYIKSVEMAGAIFLRVNPTGCKSTG